MGSGWALDRLWMGSGWILDGLYVDKRHQIRYMYYLEDVWPDTVSRPVLTEGKCHGLSVCCLMGNRASPSVRCDSCIPS
jgi:hypothetical protein